MSFVRWADGIEALGSKRWNRNLDAEVHEMIEYDPFDDVMKVDPFPVYARLRAESPVH